MSGPVPGACILPLSWPQQCHSRGLPEVVIGNDLPFGGLRQTEERPAGIPVL